MGAREGQLAHLSASGTRHGRTQARLLVRDWRSQIGYAVTILVLALTAGYRLLGDGQDYEAYRTYYEGLGNVPWGLNDRFEPAFSALAWIANNWLDVEYGAFAAGLCAISLAIMFGLVKRYSEWPKPVAVCAYVMLFYPLHQYTQVRTAMAVAFGFLALHLVLERRGLRAFLCFAVAVGFQYSALLLALPLVLAAHIKWQPKLAMLAIATALVAVLWRSTDILSQLNEMNPFMDSYLLNGTMDATPNMLSGRLVLSMLTLLAAIASWTPLVERTRRVYFCVYAAAILSYFALASFPVLSHRVSEFLGVAIVLWAFTYRASVRSLAPGALVVAQGIWTIYLAFAATPALLEF